MTEGKLYIDGVEISAIENIAFTLSESGYDFEEAKYSITKAIQGSIQMTTHNGLSNYFLRLKISLGINDRIRAGLIKCPIMWRC